MTWVVLTVLVTAQAATGAYCWRVLAGVRRVGVIEATGMGLALGTGLAVLAGCAGFLLPIGSPGRTWAWALPSIVVLFVWLARRARGHRMRPLSWHGRAEWVAVAVGLLLGLLPMFANLRNYPLNWSGTWTGYHPDMVFFEALARGTSTFSPNDSIFQTGAAIRYHWMAYSWVGDLTAASGAAPFVVLTRVLPVVALEGALELAVAWSRSLSRQPWVPTLAAMLLVSGGYVGAVYGAILNFDSPSQALSTMWLLALIVTVLGFIRASRPWPWLAAALVLAIVVAGGKFSSIIVAAGGVGVLALVGLLRRTSWQRRAWAMLAVIVLATVVTYLFLVSGSAQSGGLGLWSLLDRASSVQGLNPQTTDRGVIAGTALLIVAMVARWGGLAWLVMRRPSRWEPESLIGLGLALVGMSTIALLSGGFNDMWFALAASAPLSVLSAVGVGYVASDLAVRGRDVVRWPPRPVGVAFALGLVAAVMVALVWATGDYATGGWRWAGPLLAVVLAVLFAVVVAWWGRASASGAFGKRAVGLFVVVIVAMAVLGRPLYLAVDAVVAIPVAPHDPRIYAPVEEYVPGIDHTLASDITSDQLAAGDFVRTHANITDVEATNVTYSAVVPALTGLRTLVSGIHYQAPYGRPSAIPELLQREAESWAFIDFPSAESVAAFCRAGVSWIWVDPTRAKIQDWAPWAEVAFRSQTAVVLKLTTQACA